MERLTNIMNNIVITGANGFVGLAVTKELVSQGYFVYALVRNDNYDNYLNNPNIKIIKCEMNEYNSLIDKISDSIDCFFHFAWCGTSGELRSNEQVQLENVKHSCDAVRVAKKLGCKKFVMASSIMEYEIEQLVNGTQNISANHIYSIAKKTADSMCRLIANSIGIDYVAGLISNIYGPGEKSQRLINCSIRRLINGEYVKFSPGTQSYDFIYITDAAKLFVLLAEKGINNNIYYIGNPKIKSLKDYLMILGSTINKLNLMGIGELPSIGKGLDYSVIDINKAEREFGFKPEVNFEQGILNTYNWIKNNN